MALMFAHFHRHSYTGCKTAVSEIIASQAALVADVNDIAGASHVREKLCDIIGTAELVFAAGQASAYRAVRFPNGSWAVSYTHLDVYKRQRRRSSRRFPCGSRFRLD